MLARQHSTHDLTFKDDLVPIMHRRRYGFVLIVSQHTARRNIDNLKVELRLLLGGLVGRLKTTLILANIISGSDLFSACKLKRRDYPHGINLKELAIFKNAPVTKSIMEKLSYNIRVIHLRRKRLIDDAESRHQIFFDFLDRYISQTQLAKTP